MTTGESARFWEQLSAEASALRPALDTGAVDSENPWPGLAAFREADQAFFHGREAETEALHRLVLRERLTVLFGISGLGKTSLLQAGLFPQLRTSNIFPVYIRLDYADGHSPFSAQIQAAIARSAAAAEIEGPGTNGAGTLWEYFHRQGADFWSPRNRLAVPLLVFDQFEEVFTLGRSGAAGAGGAAAMLHELADLVEGRPPAAVKARLDAAPEAARRFNFSRHNYKVLLSLREDFLPDLEGLRGLLPSIVHNRLRLKPMHGREALQVVTAPAAWLVEREVAERIVRFVAAEEGGAGTPLEELEVEPALLSVVCRELNTKRQGRGDARITGDLLEGTRTEILSDFYERNLADLTPEVRAFVEDRLLTVSGYRESVARENALSVPGVTEAALAALIDRRLLRSEHRGGRQRVELTHDLLTGVVRASRDRRRQQEAAARAEAARREAEETARRARRDLRRVQRTAALLMVLLLAAAAGAYWGFKGQREAKVAEGQAKVAERKARVAEGRATADRDAARVAEGRARDLGMAALVAEKQAEYALARERDAQGQARKNADRAKQEQRRAEESTREAEARLLAAEAAEPSERAVLLAIESFKHHWTAEARRILARDLAFLPRRTAALPSTCGKVNALSLSPDGRVLAIGGSKGLALLDEGARSPERVADAEMGNKEVGAVAFSRDGRWLAAGVGNEIYMFDVAKREVRKKSLRVEHMKNRIDGLSMSADGRYVASAGGDSAAGLFARTSEDGEWQAILPAPTTPGGYVGAVAISPNGRWLAMGGRGNLVIWDLTKGSSAVVSAYRGPSSAVFISNEKLVTGPGATFVWTISAVQDGGSPALNGEGFGGFLTELAPAVTSRGAVVTVSPLNRAVAYLWDAAQGKVSAVMREENPVSAVAVALDGRRLATSSGEHVRLWPIGSENREWMRFKQEKEVKAIAFSHSGHWLAMAGGDPIVRVAAVPRAGEDSPAGEPAGSPEVSSVKLAAEASSVAFSPDDRWLAAATPKEIEVIDTRTWQVVVSKQVDRKVDLSSIEFSADGRWLVATTGNTVYRIAVGSWTALPPIDRRQRLTRVSFGPGGKWMATSTEPSRLGSGLVEAATTRIYEASTGRRVAWQSHEDEDLKALRVPRSPDFRAVEDSGGAKQGGRLDLLRQEPTWRAVRLGKFGKITSGDGLWSAGRENSWTVSLTDATSNRPVEDFTHEGVVNYYSFSPDSRWLVTASTDKTVRVWALTPPDLIAQACARLTRNLDPKEWPPGLPTPNPLRTCPNLPLNESPK
jgi:WD40 repeat protein